MRRTKSMGNIYRTYFLFIVPVKQIHTCIRVSYTAGILCCLEYAIVSCVSKGEMIRSNVEIQFLVQNETKCIDSSDRLRHVGLETDLHFSYIRFNFRSTDIFDSAFEQRQVYIRNGCVSV